ncbi:MAG: acyl-[ACP]--phospholipid O-acyltransferase [Acidobacteriota bacterium]
MTSARPSRHPIQSLLATQFLGAFNDNAWKLIVAFLAIRALEARFIGSAAEFQRQSQFQTTLAFVALTLPLVLFSLPAGLLADRVSKRTIIVGLKWVEAGLMILATLALALFPGNTLPLLVVLGLLGAQSALFSPAKYGILPELLPHENLSKGNALLEMWTFVAIILGTAAGGALLDLSGSRAWLCGGLLTAAAVTGLVFAYRIPPVPAARSEGNLGGTLRVSWQAIRAGRILGLAVGGSVTYWTIASLLGQNILVYSRTVLGLSDTYSGFPLAAFGLGVGLGSLLAGRLSGEKVEYGLIPLGALLMALTSCLLSLASPGFAGLLFFMAVLGIASGLVVVPLNALIQWRAPTQHRGGVIALANVFVFSGILAGSLAATLLAQLGLSPELILAAASVAIGLGTLWALWVAPDALLRLALILLTHTFYRLDVLGRRQVPKEGGALLTPNHVSFVDALMIVASLDRPIRFLVEQSYFDYWFLKPFMNSLGCIPISSSGGPRVILRALREAGRCLDEGELVCIFPEGQITRTGTLLPFRRGLERIGKNRKAPVIPVYLDRLWGSIFSRSGGRFLFKVPREIPYSVTVAFGAPLPSGSSAGQIRQSVMELASSAWATRRKSMQPLHRAFVRNARRGPFALALADTLTPRVSRLKALAGAVSLARALGPHWEGQARVGILLPPSVAGALANLAASISGRASVNLNYTAGKSGMESMVRQAGLSSVVTSRSFVEKAGLGLPQGIAALWIEEVAAGISGWKKLTSLVASVLLPVGALERWSGAGRQTRPDDVATVIFSSGSTGEPKGIMLTHYNIASNVEALTQVMRATSEDRLLGILPFFHSFGYMSFWFAAQKGLALPMHPNPLEAPAIGGLVQRYGVTILLATPTFLRLYLQRCTPAQFGSLRLVLTGAEKLPLQLALAFEDQFGIRPLEGYGCTECSPVVAASVPDFRGRGYFQPGSRRGFVGPPLPGVAIRIVDPDSFEPISGQGSGMLLVKGPNVMKAYLGREDLTRKAIRDGWYVTGDIAQVSEDGFLKITDRLSRFSKIGGEMVPHGRVEEALQEAAGAQQQIFAVTSVADPRKGESLAVLHTYEEERIPELLRALGSMGLPNLYVPRQDRFVKVDELPMLGTGKLDLREVGRLAKEAFESPG